MGNLKKSARRVENGGLPAGQAGATVGYEAELWRMADALRGSMDAAEYKHVDQRLRGDKCWKYGTPPVSNANFALVQQIVHHLAPSGVAESAKLDAAITANLKEFGFGEATI